jgi:hypothetical protein
VATPALPAPPATPAPAAPRERQLADIERAAEDIAKAQVELAYVDSWGNRDDASRSLVLPRNVAEAASQSETEEDLNVMSHLLEKAATSREEQNARAHGIWYHSPFSSSPALRNLYLEGYGAIFFLNVNYALTPPPAKADESDAKQERDSEWEDARRELSQPRGSRSDYLLSTPEPLTPVGSAAPKYDADKVESLQKNLAQALRNAIHIRKLKSDETVTIVVMGRPSSAAMKLTTGNRRRVASTVPAGTATTREKLIIRAKRSDIEAFQNEKLSLEDFRKKLMISIG